MSAASPEAAPGGARSGAPSRAGATPQPGLSRQAQERARSLMELYPEKRSALIPICHIAQAEHGWLTPEVIEGIAELLGLTPAEVRGTASFYEMLRTEPTGRYLVSICTNIACMLDGAYELLEHAEERLGIAVGETSSDGMFTLEESECLAGCDMAPCVQVNYRYVGKLDSAGFDSLVGELAAGERDADIPPHGVLIRTPRRAPRAVAGAPSGGGRSAGGEQAASSGAAGQVS